MPENNSQSHMDRLFDKAEARFFEEGVSRVTMDVIANDMGMSKKTIYKLVPGKNKLIEMIMDRFVQRLRRRLDVIPENPDLDFEAKMQKFFELISQTLSKLNRGMFMDLERFFPEIFAEVENIRRRNIPKVIKRLIRLRQESGHIREDVDVEFFSEVFLQSIQGLLRTESMEIHKLKPSEIPVRLGRLFFEGIRNPDFPTENSKSKVVSL